PVEETTEGSGKDNGPKGMEKVMTRGKRKADDSVDAGEVGKEIEKPPSKRELKRRAARARKMAASDEVKDPESTIKESTDPKDNSDVAMAESKDGG
ncbi:MAG: hypothetical protein Q9171_007555, partial [Xanthocarpia ochracea]